MSANGISHLPYKADRQAAKLELAKAKRQGYTISIDGAIEGTPDTAKPYYRERNEYDITELPTIYTTNDNDTAGVTDNPNILGLIYGRPWITAGEPSTVVVGAESGLIITTEDGATLLL